MLKLKIQDDVKAALKAGDSARRTTLSTLLAVIKNRELEKRSKLAAGTAPDRLDTESALADEEIVEVIRSEIKKRRESADTYATAGRPELADHERAEIETLSAYMPEQASPDAVRQAVRKAIAELGASGPKDIGKVIGRVVVDLKGRADGQIVSAMAKEELLK